MNITCENGALLKPYNISFSDGINVIGIQDDSKGILVSVHKDNIIRFYAVVEGALVFESTEDINGNEIKD